MGMDKKTETQENRSVTPDYPLEQCMVVLAAKIRHPNIPIAHFLTISTFCNILQFVPTFRTPSLIRATFSTILTFSIHRRLSFDINVSVVRWNRARMARQWKFTTTNNETVVDAEDSYGSVNVSFMER